MCVHACVCVCVCVSGVVVCGGGVVGCGGGVVGCVCVRVITMHLFLPLLTSRTFLLSMTLV